MSSQLSSLIFHLPPTSHYACPASQDIHALPHISHLTPIPLSPPLTLNRAPMPLTPTPRAPPTFPALLCQYSRTYDILMGFMHYEFQNIRRHRASISASGSGSVKCITYIAPDNLGLLAASSRYPLAINSLLISSSQARRLRHRAVYTHGHVLQGSAYGGSSGADWRPRSRPHSLPSARHNDGEIEGVAWVT